MTFISGANVSASYSLSSFGPSQPESAGKSISPSPSLSMPSEHSGGISILQLLEHPSPSRIFPSSHSSHGSSTIQSPQITQVVPSSANPSQSLSRPSQISSVGPIDPMHEPHVPQIPPPRPLLPQILVSVPSSQRPVSIPQFRTSSPP